MNDSPNDLLPESNEGQYRNIFDSLTDGLIIIALETGQVIEANPVAGAMHCCAREEFIGLLPTEFIHPASQPLFSKYLRSFQSSAGFDARVLDIRRDGTTFQAEWRGKAFTYQDRPCLLGVVQNISRQIRAEQQLHQRIEARTREQSTLLDISHTLASTLELQPGAILDQLRGIIDYTHAGLFGLTDSTLTALAVRGPKQLAQTAPFQVRLEGLKTLATLFNGHRPIRLADIWSTDPEAKFLRSLLAQQAAVLLEGVQAWMWVPLAVKGRIIGGLGIAHAKRNFFTAHHAALALSMADQVALTMMNAELYEHARVLAALQERQRLAQNLHDAVNQSLFSAGLIAEVLPRLWDRDPVEARQSLEDLRRLTRGAQAEMRELLAELRPSVLTDSSLSDLLRQLANAFTGRTNIRSSVNVAGENILSPEIQIAFYRICQEALNNIGKHAQASRVEIELQYDASTASHAGTVQASSPAPHPGVPFGIAVSSVVMRISDDGQGFDPCGLTAPGHYGLGMMRERAEAVGAQMEVNSQPGYGTKVTLLWPGTPKQEAE